MFIDAPDLNIKTITWTLDVPSTNNVSAWTGIRTLVTDPWHSQWHAQVELAPVVGETNARKLRSFLGRCRGTLNTFRIPATEGKQNFNSGVSLLADAAAGTNSFTITGYDTALFDGQFVTIDGQLLMLSADQSGDTITFEPKLRKAAVAGTTVVTSEPYLLVYMSSNSNSWGVSPGQNYGMSFSVSEAILETDGAAPEAAPASAWLREDSGYILREDGSRILLEV